MSNLFDLLTADEKRTLTSSYTFDYDYFFEIILRNHIQELTTTEMLEVMKIKKYDKIISELSIISSNIDDLKRY